MNEKTVVEPQAAKENNDPDFDELVEVHRAPERPDVLYRGFRINPDALSLALFGQVMVPGTKNQDDPTRIGDGNELGAYMSTNSLMVETVYAGGGDVEGNIVPTQKYVDKYGSQMNFVSLPACGVVIEVDTHNLAIREPKMKKSLIGHYNNGYKGYEWIADEIPPANYKVAKLILSTHTNHEDKMVVDVRDMEQEELEGVILQIKEKYNQAKREAEQFRDFIAGLEPEQRMNGFFLDHKWQQRKLMVGSENI